MRRQRQNEGQLSLEGAGNLRDKIQLNKPGSGENTRQITVKSLGEGDSEAGLSGEKFLMRFSSQVSGRISTSRVGRRHLCLGTSVNEGK